ncbi:hypothetical protein KSX_52350 [Ktedonospora formicarum]|uniref:Uncharacterized protein n=1 Tax=Ktedonospora formicarum TaxID=2778364 RepID=A0A8J3HZH0_9CHLR|nr:hypothetical protein KSX_52350 [Ktedonospora formicarum]
MHILFYHPRSITHLDEPVSPRSSLYSSYEKKEMEQRTHARCIATPRRKGTWTRPGKNGWED